MNEINFPKPQDLPGKDSPQACAQALKSVPGLW